MRANTHVVFALAGVAALAHGAACSSATQAEGGYGYDGTEDGVDAGASSDGSASDGAAPDTTDASPGDAGGGGGNDDGASDGAAPDASQYSTDRGAFFGAPRCASAGVAFCEDFESGALDAARWTPVGTTKPVVDGSQHARGSKALHVSITGSGASYIKTQKPFPAPMNHYWGRAFVRFAKLPGAPLTYAHWTFAAATGTGVKGEIRLSGQLLGDKNLFGVGTDDRVEDAGTGDWTVDDDDPKDAPRTVPAGEWTCIEWLHAGDTNTTRFFWDAVEHPSMMTTTAVHGGNKNPFILPTFDTVWVGWQEYQDTTLPFEMWVDEVAFDPNRIGCVH